MLALVIVQVIAHKANKNKTAIFTYFKNESVKKVLTYIFDNIFAYIDPAQYKRPVVAGSIQGIIMAAILITCVELEYQYKAKPIFADISTVRNPIKDEE